VTPTTWGGSAYFAWSVRISGWKMRRESDSVSQCSDVDEVQEREGWREELPMDHREVNCSLMSGTALPFRCTSEDEAVDLGERLDRLAAHLTPLVRAFLLEVLAQAEGAVSGHVDDATGRTCADAILAIHRAQCATDNPLGSNPQPIPTLQHSTE
jgi:hypothetical protein